ncbi:MAG TPA: hypothetical protein VGG75_03755 [Trebonia sp.]|jgi:hypothetical protein
MTTTTTQHGLLGIYLNDHLAGATAGMELARRMAASAERGTEVAPVLTKLAAEITEDRSELLKIMAALEIRVVGYKVFAAWAGEKAARLKLNSRLIARSPLSDLEEAEALRLGVEGKAAGWRSLRALVGSEGRLDAGRLDGLLARAIRQSATLEALRTSLAEQVLASGTR